MMATEPLSAQVWDQIGLAQRETFGDFRNLIIYGQRTADNRFAFGGRGAPYHFGSSIKDEYDQHSEVHPALLGVLAELFPVVADAKVTHTWGGPLGVARDWMASAGLDRKTGIAWAGGYVGDGVGTTNLSGRTLADLITNQETPITKLPWVNHKSPNWEIEPLRWIGANAGLQYAYSIFDGSGAVVDVTEHSLMLSAGVNYQILENLAVDASYNYSTLMSDDAVREFQRNNVSLGLTASF
jgi:opacity protein-like surface antigen